ncbi:hypothetical protein RCL1_000233 [Eukaryota sp. TZLM3-RCL]
MSIFDTTSVFCIDFDGTLVTDTLIPGSLEFISKALSLNKKIFYVTNNSTLSQQQYCDKILSFGLSCTPHQVRTSSMMTLEYLKLKYPAKSHILVVGQSGLITTLQSYFQVTEAYKGEWQDLREIVHKGPQFVALIVGLKRDVTFTELAHASIVLENKAVEFIATNTDSTFPSSWTNTMPGAGTLVSFISTSSGREPEIMGKPDPRILFSIASEEQIELSSVAMIGDRLDTDIAAGKAAGCLTVLVTATGVTTADDVAGLNDEEMPDVVVPSIAELVSML